MDEGLATIVKVESSQNKSDAFPKYFKPQEFIRARKLLYVVTTIELVVTTVESVGDSKSERTSLLNDMIVRVKL